MSQKSLFRGGANNYLTHPIKQSGITLIALVITIIVLLILAGISIQMLTGENSILTQAGRARERMQETQKEEEMKIAILGSYENGNDLNINKLLTNLNEINDIVATTTTENGEKSFPVKVETEHTTYKITQKGELEKVERADRKGLNVGDYITYESPIYKTETPFVTISEAESGYQNTQNLPAKNTFRIMDIDKYGNMTLIGAMGTSDEKIYFKGAIGYNNAVFTLNTKCSELYRDNSKEITARSIKMEDITSKFNDSGNEKITTSISTEVSELEPKTNVTKGTKEDNITLNNTIIYSNGNTDCPHIFQYEAGGLIDDIPTQGVIGQSDSYKGYGGLTAFTNIIPKPTNLTIPFTYSKTSHVTNDFNDTKRSKAYQNIFFGTGTKYWVASRCVRGLSEHAIFSLRIVSKNKILANGLYNSYGWTESTCNQVCPIIYVPSSVEVEISTNPKNQTNTDGIAHSVK